MKYFAVLIFGIFMAFLLSSCHTAKVSENKLRVSSVNISQQDKEMSDQLFYTAAKNKILGNYEESARQFAQCIKINPNNSAAFYELGFIFTLAKKYQEALPLVKRAVALNKENNWYQLLLSEIYQAVRNYKEAAEIYHSLIEKNPNRIDYKYSYADLLIQSKDYSEALKVYDEIEKINGITEEVSEQKERLYLELKKIDKAIIEIQKLIDASPQEARYYLILGNLYLEDKKMDKAKELYDKAKSMNPDEVMVYRCLAGYYDRIKEYDKSIDQIRQAFSNPLIDIDEKMSILLSVYDRAAKDSSLKKQVYEMIIILVKTHPDDPKAYSVYGDYLYRDKKLKEAHAQFEKVISIDSSKFAVWEALMNIEAEMQDNDKLLKNSKMAMELFPNETMPYLYNGMVNQMQKNYLEAEKVLTKGKDLCGDNKAALAQFYASLGDVYYSMGKIEKSDSSYENSLKLNPNNPYVLNNYSYYLSLRGKDLEKAAEMSKKANKLSPGTSAYLDTYAWVLFKLGNYNEAKEWVEKAMEKGGSEDADVLEHYGDILYKIGKTDRAVEFWIKAKEKNSTSEKLNIKIQTRKWVE